MCGAPTRSRPATSASSASARSRSPTTTEHRQDTARAAPAHPGGPAEHLALQRLPAARGAPGPSGRILSRVGLPAGCTPLIRADRLAERLGLRRGVGQERRPQPDALLQGPRRRRRLRARPRAGLRHAGLRLDRQPGQRGRRPGRRARAADSYVFIPSDLEEQKILATGVYGTNLVKIRGNYDDVNRLCTELSGERELGLRQRQHAPLLRRGLQDPRLRDRRAARLGGARPRRGADRLGLAASRRSPRASRSGWTSAWSAGALPMMNGAQADGCSPVATAFAAGLDVCKPGQARHDRQVAGHRQPGRRPVRARPRAPQRRRHRLGLRRRDPRGHPPAGRDDRHLHRDRRRRDHRGAGQARRARRHRPRRARRAWSSPARA